MHSVIMRLRRHGACIKRAKEVFKAAQKEADSRLQRLLDMKVKPTSLFAAVPSLFVFAFAHSFTLARTRIL